MTFKNMLIVISILFPASALAFFCPSNFNQINMGDTMDQVLQTCGKPDKQETKDAEAAGPQEWNYYVPTGSSATMGNQAQGTLKAVITFDANDKAVNISINGIGVGSSSMCGKPIKLGSTRDDVKSACGSPSFINKEGTAASSNAGGAPAADKITTFTYNSNPPKTLTFTNGVLTGQN